MTIAKRAPARHWPDFGPSLCGEMTDRLRLGLPDHHVDFGWGAALRNACRKVRRMTEAGLVACTAAADATLAERIAAGNLLALLGDPRIAPDTPAMVDFESAEAVIGLAPHDVDRVLIDFAGLGLDRNWIAKECPRHRVTLAPFRLAKFPVTNLEYRAFLIATRHPEIPTSWHFRRFPIERANHPVYTISPAAADAYARWLSVRTRRSFRLPSEAEWEWAAGGPLGREFPWGNGFGPDLANTCETGLFETSPVGVFVGGASWAGLHDMAGNVEEYVSGNYRPYPGGAFVTDHLVEIHGAYRIARGGSFARFRDLARTRRRHGHNPRSASYAMGFRLAESC